MIFNLNFWKGLLGRGDKQPSPRANGPTSVPAEPPQHSGSSDPVAECMRLMGAGDEAWRRGDVPGALQHMREAHALHAPPEVARRLATLLHYAGQVEEARGL